MLQKKAVILTFTFENCESVSIDMDKVDIMELGGITSSISKLQDNQIKEYKYAKNVAIRIKPDIVKETYRTPCGGIMLKHVRISFGDIASIEISYDNGEHDIYYVDYASSDDNTLNVNQSTEVSEKKYLYIVISGSMDVHDYFSSYIELENEQSTNRNLPKAYHFVWIKDGSEEAALAMRVYSPFSEDEWEWLCYAGNFHDKKISKHVQWEYASKDEFGSIEKLIDFLNLVLIRDTPMNGQLNDSSILDDMKSACKNNGFYVEPAEENIEYYKNKIKDSVKAAQDAIAGRIFATNTKEKEENGFKQNIPPEENGNNSTRAANEEELEERIKKTQMKMDMRKISHEASSLIGDTVGLVKHAAENAMQSKEAQKVKDAVHNAGDKAANVAGKTLHDIIYSDYVQKNRKDSNEDE